MLFPPAGRVPPRRRTSGWRGRAATATSERRCCRLPPAPASPHDWLAERRFALDEGPAPAGRGGAGRCGRWRTETAVPDGAADLVADLYRRMPAARPGELLAHVSCPTDKTSSSGSQPLPDCLAPLDAARLGAHQPDRGNTAGRVPTPSGTAKRLP